MDGDGSRGHGLLIVMLLDDDERLGDGAVAMEEHGHELVHGVVCEQQLALAAHVFEDELVGHPLEAQRYLGAVDVRAAEGADEPHRLRRRRHLDRQQATRLL